MLVLNGADLEFWADKLMENMTNPKVKTIITSQGVTLLGGHDHGNPHVWLDPAYARMAVESIRDGLIEVKPGEKDRFLRNAHAFIDSLNLLDSWIKAEAAAWKTKEFVGYHASWDYFAKRYGLKQIATLESIPGRELSAKEFGDLLKLVRSRNIRALFGDLQSPSKTIRMLAQETGAQLVMLDPLGGTMDTKTYLEMMRFNVRRMGTALRN
jgi:zinc transport system substrate-binding protein